MNTGNSNSTPACILDPAEVPVQTILTPSLQVADILGDILAFAGPSEVWQSTFSVSEEFLRRMHLFRRRKLISRSTVVLDHKACRKILKLWPFIARTFDLAYMADNHSKILLLKSGKGDKIAVITSQNLTRGNRFESTAILALPHVFDSLLKQFESMIKFHTVPLNELLGIRPKTN